MSRVKESLNREEVWLDDHSGLGCRMFDVNMDLKVRHRYI